MQLEKDLGNNLLVLDLETAGLNEKEDFISCVGLMTENGITQFSTTNKDGEKDMLRDVSSFKGKNRTLITYNGNHFDMPFLKTRLYIHNLGYPNFIPNPHVDLMEFVILTNDRRISKEEACRRYCDIYVPRMCHGKFLARNYKMDIVTPLIHSKMLQHNAVDLTATYQLYIELLKSLDFREWVMKNDKNSKGSKDKEV